MNGSKIRLGLAGCGWIAEKAHIPAFRKIADIEITSLFDIDCRRAENMAGKYSIGCACDDYDSFLKSDIDAVIVATPNYTHADYSLKALKRGKHVLCEKPIAVNAREVKEIIDVSHGADRYFIPGFVNRFRDDIQIVNDLISRGEIGSINCIKAGWLRRSGTPRPGTWFTHKKYSGGGVLIDLGSHVIDICLMLAGNPDYKRLNLSTFQNDRLILEKSASWFDAEAGHGKEVLNIDVEDTAAAEIELESGIRIDLELSWVARLAGDYTYFKVEGSEGNVLLKTLFGFSNDRLWENDVIVLHKTGQEERSTCLDPKTNSTGKAFDRMARYFVECIREGNAGFLRAEDGLSAVSIVAGLYNSLTLPGNRLGRVETTGLMLLGRGFN